uniref:hypothetical protein n=1 Tax=Trichocoleus desertorum TaxID=1481672 RepID=UPI0025B2D3C8|nr:hypothetical protein [Trichocoleus desertorum]
MGVRFWAIVGVSAVGLVVMGCNPIEYGPNQRRNWVKAYYVRPNAEFPVMFDTRSVKAVEGGVRYEDMRTIRETQLQGVSYGIATKVLSCENGTTTIHKLIFIEPGGNVNSPQSFSPMSLPKSTISEALVFERQLCKQVGVEPRF